MIHGHLDLQSTTEPLAIHPVWQRMLVWLRSLGKELPLGRVDIEPGIFALVQRYTTQPREACRFESHRENVDLQYTFTGTEIIDWAPREQLQPDGPFSVEKDVGFWLSPQGPVTGLVQGPRHFAVFYPEDAHRPKVQYLPPGESVLKLVIKIPVQKLATPGIA